MHNEDIDKIKEEEKATGQKPKPITFHVEKDENHEKVRYEIEGGGRVIETMVVRQNEEVFFDFLNEFTQDKIKVNKRLTSKRLKSISPFK